MSKLAGGLFIDDLYRDNTLVTLAFRGNALTCLVLVNAIYFKRNWASQFDQSLTSGAPF